MIFWLALAAAATGLPTAPPPGVVLAPLPDIASIDPARLATARKLILLLHLDQSMDHVLLPLIPVLTSAVLGELENNPSTRAELMAFEQRGTGGRSQLMVILAEEMNRSIRRRYPALLDAVAREYALVFTKSELDDILAFYNTSTGAKLIAMLPVLQQKIGDLGRAIGQEAGREAGVRAFQRALREMMPAKGSTS